MLRASRNNEIKIRLNDDELSFLNDKVIKSGYSRERYIRSLISGICLLYTSYVQYYSDIITEAGAEVEIIFANRAQEIIKYTDCVLTCDIHTRARTKRLLKEAGAKAICGLDDILTASVNGSGYNDKYGLLGSNKSTEDKIKLFLSLIHI